MTEPRVEESFRNKPRDRKSIIRDEVDRRLAKAEKGLIPQKPKKSPGKKIQVWWPPEDLAILDQVQNHHGYANYSITIKESVRRDFVNVAVKKEKIEEVRAVMKRYNIRSGELG